MDATRFDTISKLFARRTSRRAALTGTAVGLAAAPFAGMSFTAPRAFAQGATPTADDAAAVHPNAPAHDAESILFTQAFEGGTWEQAGDNAYTLTLTGTAAQTIYFADRPERDFGTYSMQKFIDALDADPSDPPNAALVTRDPDTDAQDTLIVELANPRYDATAATLTYDATILTDYRQAGLAAAANRQQDYAFPASFGQGGLFIDGYCSSKFDVKCTLASDGSVVGNSNDNGCCWKGFGCNHCHNLHDDCADTFPNQCLDADGNNLCNGEVVSGHC